MDFLDLSTRPLWIAIAAYVGAAIVVWMAGTRLARYADEIATRTGVSGATVGVVLLGLVTSLPEIATSITAAVAGDPAMGVNNLLGSTSWQFVVLAAADAVYGRKAITASVPNPGIMLQGVVLVVLLTLTVGGTMAGDVGFFGVGVWSTGLVLAYALGIFLIHSSEQRAGWVPRIADNGCDPPAKRGTASDGAGPAGSAWGLACRTVAVALAILVAGVVLTLSSDSVADKTGLDSGLAGLTLLAAATSLPELSSAVAAVRLGRSEMAIGDIIGGNMVNTALILLVDAAYVGEPVLNQVGRVAAAAAMLGILLTCFFLIGMIERRDRTILRMGYDSLAVILTYVGGVALLFWMTSRGVD